MNYFDMLKYETIRYWMDEQGMTVEHIHQVTGVSRQTIYNIIKNGEHGGKAERSNTPDTVSSVQQTEN